VKSKLKLHGFNNLTKTLSFNIYDICYAETPQDQQAYVEYINKEYNAKRLTQILTEVVDIIGANILNIASQDYEPQGASVTILISEEPVTPTDSQIEESPGPLPEIILAHLDKSHITVHTYPEIHPVDGIATFRVDIRRVDLWRHFTAQSTQFPDSPVRFRHRDRGLPRARLYP